MDQGGLAVLGNRQADGFSEFVTSLRTYFSYNMYSISLHIRNDVTCSPMTAYYYAVRQDVCVAPQV